MCHADCDIFGDFDTREEAIAGWNRRALAPIVPPDTEAIAWARELDRAARRHDDARTPAQRHAAARDIICLCRDDERMVLIARALLARVGAQGDGK